MDNIFTAVILGIIEGISEFLPISSTGHLILAGELLNYTGAKANCFEVVIQLGAILAVVVLYFPRFLGLLKHNPKQQFSGFYGLYLLFLTCLPAGFLGLIAHSYIKMLFHPIIVMFSLALGAFCMILVEKYKPKAKILDINALNAKQALYIGCFQCASLIPGFSRSASTIMGAMLLGLSRPVAAEYSFLAAVPLMLAATSYDLLKTWDILAISDLTFFIVGTFCAFISALLAIKVFVSLVSKYTLIPFAYYRLVLALIISVVLFV